MKLIEIYGAIANNPARIGADRIKQLKVLAEKYEENLYKMTIADSSYPSIYYYIGRSADDISDKNEIYKEIFEEDEDGYTLADRCYFNIEEV